MFHLLVDITHHGFGHVSQTSAVVNALYKLMPELQVTVRTTAPHEFLQRRFECEFRHLPQAHDFGMQMASAVDVKIQESAAAYREFHQDWAHKVEGAAAEMRSLRPDLLLANVPYLSLAAARRAGVRAIGMCCLNWADIYRHYCHDDPASVRIHAQMMNAYQDAEAFLKVLPAMPMAELGNTVDIPPIVQKGQSRRGQIDAIFRLADGEKLVMVAMGGMEFRLPVQSWPVMPGVRWIVPRVWQALREDMLALEDIQMNFSDVLASCDAVITKPGYGMFTEAAYAGIPVLYVTRRDWPEEPYLVQWLQQHDACLEVARETLQQGELAEILQRLWAMPMPLRPDADGAMIAAQFIRQNFG